MSSTCAWTNAWEDNADISHSNNIRHAVRIPYRLWHVEISAPAADIDKWYGHRCLGRIIDAWYRNFQDTSVSSGEPHRANLPCCASERLAEHGSEKQCRHRTLRLYLAMSDRVKLKDGACYRTDNAGPSGCISNATIATSRSEHAIWLAIFRRPYVLPAITGGLGHLTSMVRCSYADCGHLAPRPSWLDLQRYESSFVPFGVIVFHVWRRSGWSSSRRSEKKQSGHHGFRRRYCHVTLLSVHIPRDVSHLIVTCRRNASRTPRPHATRASNVKLAPCCASLPNSIAT